MGSAAAKVVDGLPSRSLRAVLSECEHLQLPELAREAEAETERLRSDETALTDMLVKLIELEAEKRQAEADIRQLETGKQGLEAQIAEQRKEARRHAGCCHASGLAGLRR